MEGFQRKHKTKDMPAAENIQLLEKDKQERPKQAQTDPNGPSQAQTDPNGPSSTRNIMTFFMLGLTVFTILYLGMSAAQDILAGTSVPTSSVLLTTAGPFFIATLIAPYFIPRVQATLRVILVFLLATAGILITALGDKIALKLTGVCLVSFGCGVAETSFLTLTLSYERATVNAYSGGTGAGFAIGPLYYAAMTTLACVTPQITILTIAALPFVVLLLYIFLISQDYPDATSLYRSISYDQLKPVKPVNQDETPYTWVDKLKTIKRSLGITLILVIGVIAEYMTVQAVVTTLAFENSPFSPRDHYLFYFFTFAAGEFIGRSYAIVMHWLNKGCIYLTKHTWVFALIMAANFTFLYCASWYRFLPSVWTVFLVLLEHGICAGAIYVNTFSMAGISEVDAPRREFSRAFTTLGSGLGLLAAGFIGLEVEPGLRHHCFSMATTVGQQEFCFTRQMPGWNETVHCRW